MKAYKYYQLIDSNGDIQFGSYLKSECITERRELNEKGSRIESIETTDNPSAEVYTLKEISIIERQSRTL